MPKIPTNLILSMCLAAFAMPANALVSIVAESGEAIVTNVDGIWVDSDTNFELKRTRLSFSSGKGYFGRGWCSSIEDHLDIREPEYQITFHPCAGNTFVFKPEAPSTWRAQNGALLKKTTLGYIVTAPLIPELRFNKEGRLTEAHRPSGLWLQLSYQNGKLSEVQVPGGKKITVEMNDSGFITRMSLEKTEAIYTYQADRLTSVKNFWGNTYQYSYDTDGRIVRITYPDKTFEMIAYNSPGHVTSFQDRLGCLETVEQPKGKTSHSKRASTKTCSGKIVAQTDWVPPAYEQPASVLRDSKSKRPTQVHLLADNKFGEVQKFELKFDSHDRLRQISFGKNESLESTFWPSGRLKELIHRKGARIITEYKWDREGRAAVSHKAKKVLVLDEQTATVKRSTRTPAGGHLRGLMIWNQVIYSLERQQ